jgi:hypothetical protein
LPKTLNLSEGSDFSDGFLHMNAFDTGNLRFFGKLSDLSDPEVFARSATFCQVLSLSVPTFAAFHCRST